MKNTISWDVLDTCSQVTFTYKDQRITKSLQEVFIRGTGGENAHITSMDIKMDGSIVNIRLSKKTNVLFH